MKIALVCFGNEESYGLLFVGAELLRFSQKIHYFDAETNTIVKDVCRFGPDFIFFSPMTVFFPKAVDICKKIKTALPKTISVFGGHHASSCPDIIDIGVIDTVVAGPARGAVERVIGGERGVVKSSPTVPGDLGLPERNKYYADIPRMAGRYRKIMLSMLGCPWNCAYCSSSAGHIRGIYGPALHKRYFLKRRPIPQLISEAKTILRYNTHEIEWVDDDIFSGDNADEWLAEFIRIWERDVGLPMYVSTTSAGALRIKDTTLKRLKNIVNCIGMGIQAIRPSSLKLFNRRWDNEAKMTSAYDRLRSFGFSVNLQCIVGLPLKDPVEDALDTVMGMQRVGPGSICSCYPLMIYPGTAMEKYCREKKIRLNNACPGDTNSGIPNIYFDRDTTKQLRNICKLATMFVKYNISEKWMRPLIKIGFNKEVSKELSATRYFECVKDRLKEKGEKIFGKIAKTTRLRY